VSVAASLAEIASLIEWVCSPDIALRVDAPADLPFVHCNRLDLQNAVLNLVINARDAMPGGGAISITAQLRDADLAGAALELEVRDDGEGMDGETLVRAFNPWFTTKGPGSGNGFGLAMVRRFAHEAGGKVEITSVRGLGTTVTLRLPIPRGPIHQDVA
jgi:signal transduction histidine kinase